MSRTNVLVAALLVVIACLGIWIAVLLYQNRETGSGIAGLRSDVLMMRDSIASEQSRIDQLKAESPGLGDYMSTIQLHASKIWFAAQASNWDLASYELGEIKETFDGAEALHAVKNRVDISGVIQSVRSTQISLLEDAVMKKDNARFAAGYRQTLDACNGCHRAAGYGFIHVKIPSSPPVTNQDWTPIPK